MPRFVITLRRVYRDVVCTTEEADYAVVADTEDAARAQITEQLADGLADELEWSEASSETLDGEMIDEPAIYDVQELPA